jgi:hypothetical protein
MCPAPVALDFEFHAIARAMSQAARKPHRHAVSGRIVRVYTRPM